MQSIYWFLFDLRPDTRLSKQSRRWWFEAPSRSLWRNCNDALSIYFIQLLLRSLVRIGWMLTTLKRTINTSEPTQVWHCHTLTGLVCSPVILMKNVSWLLLRRHPGTMYTATGHPLSSVNLTSSEQEVKVHCSLVNCQQNQMIWYMQYRNNILLNYESICCSELRETAIRPAILQFKPIRVYTWKTRWFWQKKYSHYITDYAEK